MTKHQQSNHSKIRRRHWEAHLEACGKSGLSQAEYCRRNNLKSNRFTYWKTKFKNEATPSVKFVPVPTTSNSFSSAMKPSSPAALKLEVAGRFHIEIGEAFVPDTLIKLVATLERI